MSESVEVKQQSSRSLDESLSLFSDRVHDCIKANKDILVATHIDCDGIMSGSMITKALIRAGARCTVATLKEFDADTAESFRKDRRNLHIVTDLGGGFADSLDGTLGKDRWMILDHHQIPDSEMDNPNVINSWRFGIDGGADMCAGSMAYVAAISIDDVNADMSSMAVVAALGDRQDHAERKSLTGKNFEIADSARHNGLLSIDMDLLLSGRESKPLPDALASTSQLFIEGLTWNRQGCLSLLDSAGIKLKDGGRWRVPAELDEGEKKQVIDAVAGFVSGDSAEVIRDDLIGYTYTLPKEDKQGCLRDGREFSAMLNSCGRIGRSGVGIAVCMGNRGHILGQAESILENYRERVKGYMNILSSQRWRTSESDTCVTVNGEDVVPETMTGTISSLMAGSPSNLGKVVIFRTRGGENNTIKFSLRKSSGCKNSVNLSELVRSGAQEFGGIGGGHDAAAGAKITKDKLDGFLNYLEANVTASMQGQDSHK